MRILLLLVALSATADATLAAEQQAAGSAERPQGQLIATGSVTMAGLMQDFARHLGNHYPGLSMQVHASGSATAPPALNDGTSTIGTMSRIMTATELNEFRSRHGYDLIELIVAYDAIVMIVNVANPLTSISLQEIDRIYSATRACDQTASAIVIWRDLASAAIGNDSLLAQRSMQRFSRNFASGTYAWFREHALCGGVMAAAVNRMLSHNAIVDAVSQTANGIGYVGYAHAHNGIKSLAIRNDAESPSIFINASGKNIIDRSYPLSRQLYLYLNVPPEHPLSAALQALLKLIYSSTGESIIADAGLLPLTPEQQQQQLQVILARIFHEGEQSN